MQREKESEPDLIESDYLIFDWMKPFIPRSHSHRDTIMVMAGIMVTTLVGILIWPIAGDVVSIFLISLGVAYFSQHYCGRVLKRDWRKRNRS